MARMKPIDDKERVKLQQLLDATFPLIESTSNGKVTFSVGSVFPFETQVFALTKLLAKYFPHMSGSQMTSMVKHAIYHLAEMSAEQQSVNKLLAKLNDDLNVEGVTIFQVIVFLNISPRSAPAEMVVDGIPFYKIDAAALRPLLDNEAERLNPYAFANLPRFTAYFYELRIPSYQAIYGPGSVFEDLVEPFEKARALLNFNHHKRKTVLLNFSTRPKPRARYLPSPYTLIRVVGDGKNEEFSLLGYNPAVSDFRFQEIAEKEWKSFIDLEKRLYQLPEETSNSTAELIDRLLRIYQHALDTTDQAVMFLHFWQVLERVASPTQIGRGLETSKVINRLDTIAPLDNTQRLVLKELGEIRHAYAHQGAFPYSNGEHLGEILKSYADECLGILISSLELVPRVIDLEEYFSIATNPGEARMQALENAIKIVRSRQRT